MIHRVVLAFVLVATPGNAGGSSSLRTVLHNRIDDHLRFPYTSSSTDTWDILELADENLDDPSETTIRDVYKNAIYTKVGGGNPDYNREHTWPNSCHRFVLPRRPRDRITWGSVGIRLAITVFRGVNQMIQSRTTQTTTTPRVANK